MFELHKVTNHIILTTSFKRSLSSFLRDKVLIPLLYFPTYFCLYRLSLQNYIVKNHGQADGVKRGNSC